MLRLGRRATAIGWIAGIAAVFAAGARASDVPQAASSDSAEPWGQIATVPEGSTDHRVWVHDRVLQHSLLFDGDTGEMLGAVDGASGVGARPSYPARGRSEVYVVETYYSRGLRGERHDQLAVYDATTLEVKAEIEIPPTAADTGMGIALGAVLDGERFFAALNQSPGSSVSIVDLESRAFVGEIVTGGCSMVYPVGPRRFGMLCGDGTALLVELDDEGRQKSVASSEKFFDVVEDPVTVAGVRSGATWSFASFEGMLHEVDFSGAKPAASEPWSLFSDEERSDGWRVGGFQHLALHRSTGRLYSIVHQGGPGSHKDAGPQIWVYDREARRRFDVIEAPNVLLGFLRPQIGVARDGFAFGLLEWIVPPPGVHSIAVTQDARPLLFARNVDLGAVGVLDARTGDHLRDLEEVGLSGTTLVLP